MNINKSIVFRQKLSTFNKKKKIARSSVSTPQSENKEHISWQLRNTSRLSAKRNKQTNKQANKQTQHYETLDYLHEGGSSSKSAFPHSSSSTFSSSSSPLPPLGSLAPRRLRFGARRACEAAWLARTATIQALQPTDRVARGAKLRRFLPPSLIASRHRRGGRDEM